MVIRAEELSLRWFAGIKAGTLRISQIKNIAFFLEMQRISIDQEEYELSRKIQDRINELKLINEKSNE